MKNDLVSFLRGLDNGCSVSYSVRTHENYVLGNGRKISAELCNGGSCYNFHLGVIPEDEEIQGDYAFGRLSDIFALLKIKIRKDGNQVVLVRDPSFSVLQCVQSLRSQGISSNKHPLELQAEYLGRCIQQ